MTVQYQGVWSLQSAAQLQSTQRWVTDPLFENTTLLLQADDAANGAQNNTFLDSSSNSFAITRNGNTTQGSFTPFSQVSGAWSNFFGGSGNYLKSGTLAAISTTQTTFTVECWVYMTQLPAGSIPVTIGDLAPESNTANWTFGPISSGKVAFYWFTTVGNTATGSTVLALNTWHHIAVSVSSNVISIYVNGVKETLTGTTTLTNRASIFNSIGMGQRSAGGEIFYGYVSNARIVSGAALYSGDVIAVPNTPLGAASSGTTQLITCQSNRFLDTSSNAVSMTPTGSSMTVQPFSPFAPQFQWTPSVIGGSGYFDGTGDFLLTTGAISFTGQFSCEAWFYRTLSGGSQRTIFALNQSVNNGFGSLRIDTDSGNTALNITASIGTSGSAWAATISSNSVYQINSWNHVLVTRDASNVVRLFVNGVLRGNATVSGTLYSALNNQLIGANYVAGPAAGNAFQGYIGDTRIINGSIPTTYQTSSTTSGTSIFTPTTAPLTTLSQGATASNVALLCNFTNASIYDGTMKNNLETVGNAQINTSIVKYGSGSMAFDGTGDWLLIPHSVDQFLSTGQFTIELWVYRNASAAYGLVAKGTGTTGWLVSLNTSNQVVFTFASSTITSSGTVAASTWTHIAVVRETIGTNQTKIYINGVNDGQGTVTTDFNQTNSMYVGADRTGGSAFNGYIDDLRITRGIARYTQNFIPPSVALPRQ